MGTEQQADNGKRLRLWRGAFIALAWVLVLCIAIQTLLAGLAVFSDARWWGSHVMFVRFFELVPLLMLVFAFAGKLRAVLKWHCAALLLLIVLQHATANVAAVGALHPVIALVMFWLALATARRSVAKAPGTPA